MTNDFLTFQSIQPTNAGSYRVVVVDADGAVTSPEAKVSVSAPAIPFKDNLADSVVVGDQVFVGKGSNEGATREPGEPFHAGKRGGKSVWHSWQSPGNGTMTITTAGSSFDTVLAVYKGTNMSNLQLVAADDDSGPFLSSEVSFFIPSGGEVFHFVVDGVIGASGGVVLSWDFKFGVEDVPKIFSQPQSQTVTPGARASFFVEAQTVSGQASYQWFFNGVPLREGGTEPVLTISDVQSKDVGTYVVRISTFTRSVISQPAVLELGSIPTAITFDKLGELVEALRQSPQRQAQRRILPASFASVSAGSLGSQVFDNFGSTTEGTEPNHASALGGSSRWFDLRATSSGVMEVDTIGSSIDTVLAVYTGADIFSLNQIASDNNGAPDGIRSKVRFNAVAGTDYLVAVDGVNGAQGNISLNWKLGNLPFISQPPSSQSVARGGTASFSVTVTGLPPALLQWRFNGTNLPVATNSLLLVTNVQSGQAGNYLVVASNFVGSVTSAPVSLTLVDPPSISVPPLSETVNQGQAFGFNVVANGTPPLTYYWFQNGTLRASGSQNTLNFASVQSSDAGNYLVIVSNAVGQATSSPPAVLTVLIRPSIASGPTNRNVVAGTDVQFAVVAAGSSPFTYQWRWKGAPLPGNTLATLSLLAVQTNQAGLYDVIVRNAAGSVTSSPALLTIRSPLQLGGNAGISAANGVFRFTIQNAAANQPVVIDASSNLVSWESIATNIPSSSTVEVTDPMVPTRARRYYRARELP